MSFSVYIYPYPQQDGCSLVALDRALTASELDAMLYDSGYYNYEEIDYIVLDFPSREAAEAAGLKIEDSSYFECDCDDCKV